MLKKNQEIYHYFFIKKLKIIKNKFKAKILIIKKNFPIIQKTICLKQTSQFHSGVIKSFLNLILDDYEAFLIKLFRNKRKIFILGSYNSGTRWLNYLIIENTPKFRIYTLRNQHHYLSDNNQILRQFKHGVLEKQTLNQKNLLIIYVIRDFKSWLKSYLKNPYDLNKVVPINDIYNWYC